MDARRGLGRLFRRIVAAAEELVTKPRPKASMEPIPAKPRPALIRPEPIPADGADHAVQFAQDWCDRFEYHARRRMRELGIPEHRIGAYDVDYDFRHAAFFPKGRTGGENSPGVRINLNSGLLNPELLAEGRSGADAAQCWQEARLRDRIDAVIVHEEIEGLAIAEGQDFDTAHATAVAEAPYTPRPISAEARRILRAMAGHGNLLERQR